MLLARHELRLLVFAVDEAAAEEAVELAAVLAAEPPVVLDALPHGQTLKY